MNYDYFSALRQSDYMKHHMNSIKKLATVENTTNDLTASMDSLEASSRNFNQQQAFQRGSLTSFKKAFD